MTGALGHVPPPPRSSTGTVGRVFVFLISMTVAIIGWAVSFSMSVFAASEVSHAAFGAALHFIFLVGFVYIANRSVASKFAYRWSAALFGLACCIPFFVLCTYYILVGAGIR